MNKIIPCRDKIVYLSKNGRNYLNSNTFSTRSTHKSNRLSGSLINCKYPSFERRIGLCSLSGVRFYSSSYESSAFTYISNSAPTEYVKQMLISIHDYSGLPWWATVISTTIVMRTAITLPLAAYQNYILAKVENLNLLEMPDISKEVKKETELKAKQNKWSTKQASLVYRIALKKRWDALIVRDNCHPFKATVTLWFQLPTWIFFSSALRNLAYMLPFKDAVAQIAFLQLSVGSFLWIPNLVQPDGTLILPVLLGLSSLSIIEIQALRRFRDPTRLQRYATNFFRTFSILLIPISATVPSVLCLYWTTSSILGLLHNLLLMSNKVRIFCRIPETPSTLEHPYLQLAADIKSKGRQITKIFRKI